MKAYQVGDGEYAHIFFAETAGQARQWGMNEFGIDFIAVEVRRAKWADEYGSESQIPKWAYLLNGWWWECQCGHPQYDETAVVIEDMVYCEDCEPKEEELK